MKPSTRVPKITEQPSTSVLTVPLTDLDRETLDEMARMTGHSAVNVVRLALWHYAHHLDARVSTGVFGVRRAEPARAVALRH